MIRKYIPDTITSMNLLCGVLGVIATFRGRVDLAFLLMLAAAVFDFLDGFAARLLHAYSDMGKELDSLCDVVSFGVLPSLMLVEVMRSCTWSDGVICYVPLVIAVFSALRLAKFNVDERQHDTFIGLATPACAMLCGSLCYLVAVEPDCMLATWCSGLAFIPVLSVVLSALLICEVPMFSFKFKRIAGDPAEKVKLHKRLFFLLLAALAAVVVLCLGVNWSAAVLLALLLYIVVNLAYAVFRV